MNGMTDKLMNELMVEWMDGVDGRMEEWYVSRKCSDHRSPVGVEGKRVAIHPQPVT